VLRERLSTRKEQCCATATDESVVGHAPFQARKIRIRRSRHLAKVTLAFAVLALKEVALPLFATQKLAGTSLLEALGNGLSRLGFSGIGHDWDADSKRTCGFRKWVFRPTNRPRNGPRW